MQHLQRRSKRPYRPPEGESWLRHLDWLGLISLPASQSVEIRRMTKVSTMLPGPEPTTMPFNSRPAAVLLITTSRVSGPYVMASSLFCGNWSLSQYSPG